MSLTRCRLLSFPPSLRHAGYSYSGPTAAYGFKHMLPADISRIFILGPSHHYHTRICEGQSDAAESSAEARAHSLMSHSSHCPSRASVSKHGLYATPVGSLTLDREVTAALKSTKAFAEMSTTVDEDEHSIEMQLPFLAHVMSARKEPFTIVPILVGNLSGSKEAEFGKILAPYLQDPANFFVISSDFCQLSHAAAQR